MYSSRFALLKEKAPMRIDILLNHKPGYTMSDKEMYQVAKKIVTEREKASCGEKAT